MKKLSQTLLCLVLIAPFITHGQLLMSDVEKGQRAAIQMEINEIQSQYMKQNLEAQLQAQRNNLELQKLEIEKMRIQLELTRQAQEMARLKAANGGR